MNPSKSQMYKETAGIKAQEANIRFREADEAAAEARDANQTGDDFVLVAVVMATVLFFTGISTKLRGRPIRIAMLLLASVFFILGLGFMLSLPQSFAI